MNNQQTKIFRFKISLLNIESKIWRVIEVPEDYTFWDLHVAIQDAMGWLDYHLHSFTPKSIGKSGNLKIGIPESPTDDSYVAGWTVPITKYFLRPKDNALYEYDFGDGWTHKIELLAIDQKKTDSKYPRCLKGERACPPEDCGGVSGYYRLIEILSDQDDPEYTEMVFWLKEHAKNYHPYNPNFFDPKSVNFWNPQKRWRMMMGLET